VLSKFIADQLHSPSSGITSWILSRLWNRRNSALNDFAFDHLDLGVDDRVLEVGFGGGYLLERMAEVVTDGFLAGVDISEAMVDVYKRRYRSMIDAGRLEVRCAQAEKLPYPSECFNKCCTVNSLFYWADVQQGIAEIYRVLENGGRLVAVFTCKQSLEDKSFVRDGISLYRCEEIQRMMKAAGFNIVEMNQAADRHRDFLCIVGET
jgi:ubiquinone/menaquinone biosynthesis C-methylase UbiE